MPSKQVPSKLEPITGLFEINELLFKAESAAKSRSTFLEEILKKRRQSDDLNENSINGLNDSKIVDVSVLSSDLFATKKESLLPKISKKRKRLKNSKRRVRQEDISSVSAVI